MDVDVLDKSNFALSYTLKLSIENCSQTAADKDMVTTASL